MASRIFGEHITIFYFILAKLKKSKINNLNLVPFRHIKNHCSRIITVIQILHSQYSFITVLQYNMGDLLKHATMLHSGLYR
jgi:hypothetical protein